MFGTLKLLYDYTAVCARAHGVAGRNRVKRICLFSLALVVNQIDGAAGLGSCSEGRPMSSLSVTSTIARFIGIGKLAIFKLYYQLALGMAAVEPLRVVLGAFQFQVHAPRHAANQRPCNRCNALVRVGRRPGPELLHAHAARPCIATTTGHR